MNKITNFLNISFICLGLTLLHSCGLTDTGGINPSVDTNTTTGVTDTNDGVDNNPFDDYDPPGSSWVFSWSDEFNGSSIDSSTWTHEKGQWGWGNGEKQNYTDSPDNSYLEDGKLVIKAIRKGTAYNQAGNYTSARMISENKYSFQYGLIAIRMKAPYGRGIWPAMWMLGQNFRDVGWPRCGEIDIFEMFGGQGDIETSYRRTTGAMHWEHQGGHRYEADELIHTERLADDFNIYSLEWNERELIWRFNGEVFQTRDITDPELDEFRAGEFFLLLNIATGSGGAQVPDPDANTPFPQTMEIDWIRVYTNRGGSTGNVNEGTSGARRVFADAGAVASVPLAEAANPIAFRYAENNEAWSVGVTTDDGNGALSSDKYISIRETAGEAAGRYAGFGSSVSNYNMRAVANSALRFYARSSVVNNILVELEGPAGNDNKSSRANVNFTADGTWQEITIPMASFAGGAANLGNLGNIVFVIIDPPIPNVTEAVSVDIDEVQFVVVNIGATDADAVSAAKAALEIGYTGSDNAGNVRANVTLPTSGGDGVSISWVSSHLAIVGADGRVIRPTDANTEVTLTATLGKGTESASKVFPITVIQAGVENEMIRSSYCSTEVKHLNLAAEAATAIRLTIENVDATTVAIEIESTDADPVDRLLINGSGATISPANPNTTVNNGVIRTTLSYANAPANIDDLGDFAILWSKDSFGGEWILREGNLEALPFNAVCSTESGISDADAVSAAKAALAIGYTGSDNAGNVRANVTLVNSGVNGVSVAWESDNDPVIAVNGTVIRPTDMDRNVILTATLNKGTNRATKTFTVTVIQASTNNNLDNYQPPDSSWVFSWSDEFDGSSIDSSTWTHEMGQWGWGNNELQNYTGNAENSYVSDGKLTIKALHNGGSSTGVGNYTSARMVSEDKYSFQYGLIAIRMKAPYGRGVWPAMWMLGQNFGDVGWPQCGEIDIFEMFGGQHGDDETSFRRTTGAIHWNQGGRRYEADGVTHTERLANDFNIYSLEWNEREIIWRFNGVVFQTRDITDPEREEFRAGEFFLLLNIAVGGDPVPDPDTSVFPQTMEIDWIRVYTNANGVADTNGGNGGNGGSSGTRKIFADAASVADVPLVEGMINSRGFAGNTGCNSQDEILVATEITTGTDGAAGSASYVTLSPSIADACYAGYLWEGIDSYDATVANTALKFYVRSTDANVNKIKVKLETADNSHNDDIEMTFTADGSWQEVVYPLNTATFTQANYPTILRNIEKVVFVLSDVNGAGAGIGAQSLDIDEVRFEVQ